jgi:hypothetical protein
LRFPVTALVVGLEEESGFRELVRRVGEERAKAQRFGKGYDIWNPPTPEQLNALCIHACGSFEDWTYTLFRDKQSLAVESKRGNNKLYALLCKIRRNVQDRLTNILVAAYAHEPDEEGAPDAVLFGGCYFAASGDQPGRQAFIKGVFDKLVDQQEDLEWTAAARLEDERSKQWAQIGFGIDFLLVLGLAAMFTYVYFFRK